ncbi:unnamed protein product [Linum trigynum]|uniref:Uncharacterized protein n=1 Tax=Linum trigynum TaxID=586398 RepID=A0AAV2F9F4_9ROSI
MWIITSFEPSHSSAEIISNASKGWLHGRVSTSTGYSLLSWVWHQIRDRIGDPVRRRVLEINERVYKVLTLRVLI